MFGDFHETPKLGYFRSQYLQWATRYTRSFSTRSKRYLYAHEKSNKIFGQLNRLFSMKEFLHLTQRFKPISSDFIKIR